jgi:hypothetical protein
VSERACDNINAVDVVCDLLVRGFTHKNGFNGLVNNCSSASLKRFEYLLNVTKFFRSCHFTFHHQQMINVVKILVPLTNFFILSGLFVKFL